MYGRQPTEINISYEISDLEVQDHPPSYNQVLLEKREKYKYFIPFIVRGVIAIMFVIVFVIYYKRSLIQ